jgi:circadian clock protein KaiB
MLHADKAVLPKENPVLRLYIAGNSPSSRRAEQNLETLRALAKAEGWHVEVIDVIEHPELAEKASILATPTLSYEHSDRPRRIVGDLSDTKRVLTFLGIEAKGSGR